MHRLPILLAACASVFTSAAASAQVDEKPWDGDFEVAAKYRSDVVFGVSGSAVFGNAVGYPNEADKLDVAAFRADTEFGAGAMGTLWLGGALTDYLTVGVGASFGSLRGNDLTAAVSTFLLRLEGYPWLALGLPHWGFSGEFGAGGATITEGNQERADAGILSVIRLGSFYELVRFGGLSLGPSLEYTWLDSESFALHSGSLGLRVAYYTGP